MTKQEKAIMLIRDKGSCWNLARIDNKCCDGCPGWMRTINHCLASAEDIKKPSPKVYKASLDYLLGNWKKK